MGWSFSHQSLLKRQSHSNMNTGQPDQGNSSIEVVYSWVDYVIMTIKTNECSWLVMINQPKSTISEPNGFEYHCGFRLFCM